VVHRAMQAGLHRDPSRLPAMSVLQAELRRRLWITILDLLVQSALDSWMPPRISPDEFDTAPPSNIDDDDLDETTTELRPHPDTHFTDTSVQLALLDSFPTRLRIVSLLNGLHSELSYDRVLALSAELTLALQRSGSLLAPKANKTRAHDDVSNNNNNNNTNNGNSRAATPFHRSFLDYLVRRYMIPLHMSFSNQAATNPLFHYSLSASLDAALALVCPDAPSGGSGEAGDCSASFARLLASGGGLFREGLRSAITAVGFELLAHVAAQRHSGSLGRNARHREVLKSAVRDCIALSEVRIRLGETNVKSHMFLAMILGQVEAAERGDETAETAVARAARDSLSFCYGLLKNRIVAGSGGGGSSASGSVSASMFGSPLGGLQAYAGLGGFGSEFDWESLFTDVGFA
jgi:hypothetical protein